MKIWLERIRLAMKQMHLINTRRWK